LEPFVRPSSSVPSKREYPATSAARIAVRRRTAAMSCLGGRCLNQLYLETGGDPSLQMTGWVLGGSPSPCLLHAAATAAVPSAVLGPDLVVLR
jgi:hypothetical protein